MAMALSQILLVVGDLTSLGTDEHIQCTANYMSARNPSFLNQPSCQPQHDLHSSSNSVPPWYSLKGKEPLKVEGRMYNFNISVGHRESPMSTQTWSQVVGGQAPKTDAASY